MAGASARKCGSRPIAGTSAIRYLAEVRVIDTEVLPTDAPLRFHANCPFVDAGVDDKPILLDEREFFQALAVLKREG